MKFDMHVHSNYSDGNLSPSEIIKFAKLRNLDGIAITDHDTILGVSEALNLDSREFKIIPGIEFSCQHDNEEVHILGYFIDYKSEKLLEYLNNLVDIRINRAKKIINKLNKMNINISINKIHNFDMNKKEFVGRFQIAKTLVENGYVTSTDEAFEKYLAAGKPAYVPKDSLDLKSTIDLIKEIGGISSLAHPGLLKDKSIVNLCRDLGIHGIECFHSKHSSEETAQLVDYAKSNNLITTGGSDCHGIQIKGDLLLGQFYCRIEKGNILYDYIQG